MRRISCMLLKAAHRSALPLASSNVQTLTAGIETSPPAPCARACKTGLRGVGPGMDLPSRSVIKESRVSQPKVAGKVYFSRREGAFFSYSKDIHERANPPRGGGAKPRASSFEKRWSGRRKESRQWDSPSIPTPEALRQA